MSPPAHLLRHSAHARTLPSRLMLPCTSSAATCLYLLGRQTQQCHSNEERPSAYLSEDLSTLWRVHHCGDIVFDDEPMCHHAADLLYGLCDVLIAAAVSPVQAQRGLCMTLLRLTCFCNWTSANSIYERPCTTTPLVSSMASAMSSQLQLSLPCSRSVDSAGHLLGCSTMQRHCLYYH